MGQVDLNPPPVGTISNIKTLLQQIKKYKENNQIPDGEWIFAWGYDESQLTDKRHPNKTEWVGTRNCNVSFRWKHVSNFKF